MNYTDIEKDNEGYLLDPQAWYKALALDIAKTEDITLDEHHWLIIEFIRDYYESNQSVPELRKTLAFLKVTIGIQLATRKYVYSLFPYGYGQQACKIAGMRKPLKLMLDV